MNAIVYGRFATFASTIVVDKKTLLTRQTLVSASIVGVVTQYTVGKGTRTRIAPVISLQVKSIVNANRASSTVVTSQTVVDY